MNHFPLPYRWFLIKGLSNWQPWEFIDTPESVEREPLWSENVNLAHQFKTETGADFDVYLFARRRDMDDFAFFVIREGKIEDKVVRAHLSFANSAEVGRPLRYPDVKLTFLEWIRQEAIWDVADWMSEENLHY